MFRWLILLLVVAAMMEYSLAEDAPPNSSCSPDYHPVNNIQIGHVGGCSDTCNATAIDELLILTRAILDHLQNKDQCSTPTTEPEALLRDCAEIQAGGISVSGVYTILPDGVDVPFDVYCDMKTDGGGWTVFQRRQDGTVDFFLDWDSYKIGFGNVSAEHWLGNDNIHLLSTQKEYQLRVELGSFQSETRYATYSTFSLGDETSQYTLTVDGYAGDAGDSLSHHSGQPFSTHDQDHDKLGGVNCAGRHVGAWWYIACYQSNLNGEYQGSGNKGVAWRSWLGDFYSLKTTEMKIRPV